MTKAPTPSTDAPAWGVAMLRDLVDFIRTLRKQPCPIPAYTVANLPSASTWYTTQTQLGYSSLVFVTNESGGSVPAFTDGTNWRRVTDRAIVS